MSEKENQHYVPKFYLRKFSFQENNKQIGLLNLNSEFYFPTANIKNQASKSYFYGRDLAMENALGILESMYSNIINSICQKEKLPKKTAFDFYLLIQFIVLTGLRNPVASETTNESFHKFRSLLKSRAKGSVDFKDLRLTQDDLKYYIFGNLTMITEICMELEYKIIKNRSSIPFITSDNPLIKYNQFLEKRKFGGSATGYASLGLQIVVPLSPLLAIIGYDRTIYKIGFNKQFLINTSLRQDIEGINLLQFSNCYKNVYFNQLTPKQYLFDLLNISKRFPKANIGMAAEHPLANERGEILKNQTLSVMYRTDCKTKLELSFIKETRQAKLLKLDNKVVHLRKGAQKIRKKYNV